MPRPDRSRLAPLFWALVAPLALVLLLLQADTRGIWQDEGLTLYQIRLPFPEILANQIPVAHHMTPNTVPPLFFLLLGTWGNLFGFDLWTLRLFSILCALLLLFVLYRVGRTVGGAQLGRVAALLAALSPVLWWYAQELRMYAFLLLPATLSFGLLWRWYRRDAQGFPFGIALAYAVTAAVMLYTHYISFYLIAAQLLWLAFVLYPRHPRTVLALGAVVAVVALPLIPFALNRLTLGAERDYFFMPLHAIAADVVQSFAFGTPKFVSRVAEIGWLLPLAWGLLAAGLWQAKRVGGWALAALLGLTFALPIVAVALIGYIKPLYQNVRHLYIVAPAFYLLWAFGLARLAEVRRWLPVLVVLLFSVGWSLSTVHYFAPDQPLKNDLRPFFEELARRYAPGEVVALNDPVLQHTLNYFAPGVPWEILPPYGEENQDVRELAYRNVAGGYERVWAVWGPPDSAHQTWRELKDYYEEHYGRLDYLEFPGQTRIEAGLFDTRGEIFTMEPLPVAIPDEASFGDGLRFLGLARPLTLGESWEAGQRLVVQTMWRAESQPTQDYQFVVSLVDGAGQLWAQHQTYPYNGLHQTSHWIAGQHLRLPLFLDIPATTPPGVYRVTLHLIAPDGSARYAEGAAQPKPLLGEVGTVLPESAAPVRAPALTDNLRVEAVDLTTTLPPAPTLPLRLRLHVESTEMLPTAFRLSLRDAGGLIVWTQDIDPAQGSPRHPDGVSQFPPALWQAGDTFDLQYTLTFPPNTEGEFALHITALNGDTPLPAPTWGGLRTGDSVELGAFTITPRARRFDAPPVAVPLNAEWFNAVRLLGYNADPATPDTDSPWTVELVWQGIAPTERPYKVFLHVLDSEGNFVTGADGFLEVPSNAWQPDEITVSRHRFEAGALPTGAYTLITGLYHEESGERLPIDAPNFAAPLGDITVP